ncbi:hypothetical protein JTE90_008608 [Oedothorax gibbosus]|uniref:Uncharacterized protein n=1 Tax=Oedothorax gibbosus TaxID=931172 RepID=A0AAV6UDZ4_9ARAC|nr:hypothetical protein JTE90_008608 [Oedothorax gibbosus]
MYTLIENVTLQQHTNCDLALRLREERRYSIGRNTWRGWMDYLKHVILLKNSSLASTHSFTLKFELYIV